MYICQQIFIMLKGSAEAVRSQLVRGDNTSLGKIYIDCKSYCLNYFRKKYKIEDQEFNDLYTDAALILRQNIINNKVTSLDSIKSYLLTICLNLRKKKYTEFSRIQKKNEEIRLLYYPNSDKKVDDDMYKDNQEKAHSSLKQLSKKCQEVLIAYYVHDLSMKEIAVEMEFSSANVAKTSKMRCRKKWLEYFNLKS